MPFENQLFDFLDYEKISVERGCGNFVIIFLRKRCIFYFLSVIKIFTESGGLFYLILSTHYF